MDGPLCIIVIVPKEISTLTLHKQWMCCVAVTLNTPVRCDIEILPTIPHCTSSSVSSVSVETG